MTKISVNKHAQRRHVTCRGVQKFFQDISPPPKIFFGLIWAQKNILAPTLDAKTSGEEDKTEEGTENQVQLNNNDVVFNNN